MSKIELIHGSCADQVADVIVNAANGGLWAGGGICGVIFQKAGMKELTDACSKYKTPLNDGDAVITPAFNLTNAKAIIHAVGPNFGVTPTAFEDLFNAYYNSLVVMKDNGYHSISFPLISSGIFGGNLPNPVAESTKQCCRAYDKFVRDYPEYDIDVKLCAYGQSEMVNAKAAFDANRGSDLVMELFEGRPESCEGRLPREIRVYDYLDKIGIEYKRVDHEAATTMEACEEVDKALGTLMCKNLFLCNRQKTRFYLLLMPGDKKFKTKELSSQINSARLSFAEAEDMLKYLDIEPGAVSVMGLMNDKNHEVQLLVDEDLKAEEFLGCHPCVCTSSLKIRTADIFEKFLPAIGHEPQTVHLVGED